MSRLVSLRQVFSVIVAGPEGFLSLLWLHALPFLKKIEFFIKLTEKKNAHPGKGIYEQNLAIPTKQLESHPHTYKFQNS